MDGMKNQKKKTTTKPNNERFLQVQSSPKKKTSVIWKKLLNDHNVQEYGKKHWKRKKKQPNGQG